MSTDGFAYEGEVVNPPVDLALETLTDDIAQVFSTPQGERVLLFLRDFCHFIRPTMDSQNAIRTAQNEGKRLVYLELISRLQYDDNEMIHQLARRKS